MKYTKIHPFDLYHLLEKASDKRVKKLPEVVKISIGGISEPYSMTEQLMEFNGQIFLRTSCVPASAEALEEFDKSIQEQYKVARQQSEGITVSFDPESE